MTLRRKRPELLCEYYYTYVCVCVCVSMYVRVCTQTHMHAHIYFASPVKFSVSFSYWMYLWLRRKKRFLSVENWWWQAFHCLACLIVNQEKDWREKRQKEKDEHLILLLLLLLLFALFLFNCSFWPLSGPGPDCGWKVYIYIYTLQPSFVSSDSGVWLSVVVRQFPCISVLLPALFIC